MDKLSPIKELTKMMAENDKSKKRKPLLEGYLSEDDFDPQFHDEYAGDEEAPHIKADKEDEEAPMSNQGILPIKAEIDQIRQIALKTIARLAENPLSESYQMMKKIWIMCDKAIEAALQPEEISKKSTTTTSI